MDPMMSCNPQPVVVVAVCNFTAPFPVLPSTSSTVQFLPFFIGERIKIISHSENWCFGQYESFPEQFGIFPAGFVEPIEENPIDDEVVQRRASTSVFYSDEEAKVLLAEITEALKGWWKFVKSKYARGLTDLDFQKYISQMKELMLIRKKILSGSIPTEELRELRHECAGKIDFGNHLMGLGMHIRDEASRILRIDKLSVVEAYREHEKAYSKVTSENVIRPQSTAIILNMSQIDFKLHFDCELTIILWHNGAKKAISEPLTLKWSKNLGKFDHKSLNSMFIGLTEKELMDDKLELAVSVAIFAPIDIAVLTANGKYVKADQFRNAVPYKQPLAEARMSLAEKLWDISDKEKRELRLSLKPIMPIDKYQPFSARRGEFFIEFTLQKLKGGDLDDIRLRHPEVFVANPPIPIRKLMPDNIRGIMDEIRNEIYFKLGSADLHGGKHSDKNIELILKIYDDEGNVELNLFEIITPDGIEKMSIYKSRIFCLEDKPNFGELVKICLPEKSKNLHLRILFFNRRIMEKMEKGPFAMSYLKILNNNVLEKSQLNEELIIYKLEKYEEKNVSYLRQFSTKFEQKNNLKPQLKQESNSFILNEKNYIIFDTTVISCIHTVDSKLMQIFKFKEKQQNLGLIINNIISQDDLKEELIKFLPDFLDCLFLILEKNENLLNIVFNAIVYVMRICEEEGQENILIDYVEKFYLPNIFIFLSKAIIEYIDNSLKKTEITRDPLIPIFKCLKYLIKIIIKSNEFNKKIKNNNFDISNYIFEILKKLKNLVENDRMRMICQNAALKYLPNIFPILIEFDIFEPIFISEYIKNILQNLSNNIIKRQKIIFINEIILTDLFKNSKCIDILLPIFLDEIINQLYSINLKIENEYLEIIELSSKVLFDIIEKLFPFSQLKSVYQTGIQKQLELIISKTLRPIIQTNIFLISKYPSKIRPIQAILLALLNKFSTQIFINFLNEFNQNQDKFDFLVEILHMFRDILDRCPFPIEWYQMRYLQNKMFMKHVRFIKAYILKYFLNENIQIWLEFFKTAGFIIQKIIPNEETSIYNFENRLMRESAALTIRSMWFSLLFDQKSKIIDKILGDLIQVSLVDDKDIRSAIVPIFYDMMMIEKNDEKRFVDEFIMHLDPLVDTGLGNMAFKNQLKNQLLEMCCKDDYVQLEFVEKIDRLMELLLNLRQVRNDADCVESGKFCLVQLIDFYESINLNELKVHHLNNLYAAHLESGSNVEAAFTLKRISELLDWSKSKVPSYISKRQYDRGCSTQVALRECLFVEMASLFDKGEHWEKSIKILKELIPVYEDILIDYGKLADLHRRIGTLYDKINAKIRTESYYFFVSFYGKGFPDYLSNKKFVFRGEKLEMLGQFKERMLNKYFGSQYVDNMDNCDSLMNSDGKFLQIIPITPVKPPKSSQKQAETALIRWYFKHHDVCEFEQIRSERKDKTKWTKIDLNDSTRLWIRKKIIKISHKLPGILNFSPVENEIEPEILNPVEVAIQKIEEVNENLRETAEMVVNGFNEYIINLGGWIRGVLQADVGGGIKNYDSFFTDEVKSEATIQEIKSISKLGRLLLHHVAILESCLCVHASKPNLVNESLHAALVDLFLDYKRNIESRFGPSQSLLSNGNSIYLPASGNLAAASFTSTPSFGHGSTSSLSLDESTDKQNVIFRAVPGAATLLRSTMNRSKIPNTVGKKLIQIDCEFDQSRDQMLQTLRELACRSIVTSPEPRDTLKDFEAIVNGNRINEINDNPPPLPQRLSEFHGPLISEFN